MMDNPFKINSHLLEATARFALSSFGPAGQLIDHLVFGVGSAIRAQRIEETITKINVGQKLFEERLSSLENRLKEECYDAVLSTLRSAAISKTGSEKHSIFGNIIVACTSANFLVKYPLRTQFIDLLGALGEEELLLLRSLLNHFENEDLNQRAMINLTGFHISYESQTILGLDRAQFEIVVEGLISRGLVSDLGKQYSAQGRRERIGLTRFAFAFVEFIRDAKDQLNSPK